MQEAGASAVTDPSVYENTDYDAWASEDFDIAITLYDGKIIPLIS